MMKNKRLISIIMEIVIGIVLAVCGYTGIVDEYWGGMGTALVIVGSLMLVRQIKYKTNTSYKEEVDVQVNDERYKYLRVKAWSWAGYLFVMIAAFASIILKIFGYDQYSMFAGCSVGLLIFLYWISYVLLSRKY